MSGAGCDVARDDEIDGAVRRAARANGTALDGLLHSIAFAPREALAGDFLDGMSREAFAIAHDISSYSFAALAKGARPLMQGRNASLLTLTYLGAVRALAELQRDGPRQGEPRGERALSRRVPRPRRHPRQRHLGRTDQDARRGRHRRLLEDPAFRRADGAAAAQRDDRRSRQRRRVPAFGPRERDHRRDHLRRLRLLDRRRRHGRG